MIALTNEGGARHLCAHPDCKLWLPANRFACRTHWRQLPRKLRDEINAAFSAWEIAHGRETVEQLRAVQNRALAHYREVW